jgi:hypothetical protein
MGSTPRIRLATQGDDLGSCHTANLAFEEAYKKGILRNASLLSICPGIVEAAEMLAGEKGLCFGLHSSMNSEWDSVRWGSVAPPDKVPSLLAEDGKLFQTTTQLFHSGPKFEEIMIELQAQLDYARKLGFEVTYADAHCGWTWILKEREDEFGKWCEREGLIRRKRYDRLPKVEIEGDPVEKLIARLEAAEPGTYATGGHPGYDNEEMRALGHEGYPGERVASEREWERRIHSDERIVKYCKEHDVVPIRHDEA